MKILIFSDTHLTQKFTLRKFEFLNRIINESDKVIIAGDFWEGKLITFDQFINSEWKSLFPLLKRKDTVYVYGNHDKRKYSDSRVSLFSEKQTEEYRFNHEKYSYIVRHGDTKKIKYSLIKRTMKITRMTERFFMLYFHEKLEHVLTVIFGPKILQILFKKYNTVLKKTESGNLEENQILICGHTHAAEIDLENHFVNTGIIRHGLGQYVTINGSVLNLHELKY